MSYEITRSAALHPEAIALPTESPPLWIQISETKRAFHLAMECCFCERIRSYYILLVALSILAEKRALYLFHCCNQVFKNKMGVNKCHNGI